MKQDMSIVVHANDLVNASYNLSLNEIRLILLACSMIDSRGKPIGSLFISVMEFEKAFGLERDNRTYENLRNAAKSLIRNPIVLFDSEKGRVTEIVWLVSNQYEIGSNGAGVTIQFSPLIEPYLFEIKKRFTAINFEVVAKLNTPFSVRLYQWLKEAENKIECKRKHNVVEITFDVEWMKRQTKIEKSYERFYDFEKYMIKPSVQKINAASDISVFYDTVKVGRKVTAIKFYYVTENFPQTSKPLRPRLFRRPKVKKGSHEEGVWMRKNLDLLINYARDLKAYDSKAKMDLADLRKMAEYASIYDSVLENVLRKEIAERTGKAA